MLPALALEDSSRGLAADFPPASAEEVADRRVDERAANEGGSGAAGSKLSAEVAATIERSRAAGYRFLMIDLDLARTTLGGAVTERDPERIDRAIVIAEKVLATVARFEPGIQLTEVMAQASRPWKSRQTMG
jgi:predicted kinase